MWSTPFPTFPQRGRSIKTFPPWGKMKGGNTPIKKGRICYQDFEEEYSYRFTILIDFPLKYAARLFTAISISRSLASFVAQAI